MVKLSVNIVTRNRASELDRTFESIFFQDYKDFEVVVVNDCSDDATLETLNKLVQKYPNIRIISNEKQLGIARSRDIALKNSLGEYIAVIDDHDIWTDNFKLTKQINFLETNRDFVVVGTHARAITRNSGVVKFWQPPLLDEEIRNVLLVKNVIGNVTACFKKQSALYVGGYLESDEFSEDYSLWLRMGKVGKLANLKDVCVDFWVNDSGVSTKRNLEQIKTNMGFVNKYKNDYPNYFLAMVKWNAMYLLRFLKLKLYGNT